MPGRDMSSGSYAIREVKAAFTRAAGTLRELTTEWEDPSRSARHLFPPATTAPNVSTDRIAAAVAAAAAAAPDIKLKQQKQQQQQAKQPQHKPVAFEVVEDREAWAVVQADGQAQSVAPAAAAGRGLGSSSSSSSPWAAGSPGAVAAAAEQQLTLGLKQGFGMLGKLVDVVAALGRGATADSHRSEKARHAALRGQARCVWLLLLTCHCCF